MKPLFWVEVLPNVDLPNMGNASQVSLEIFGLARQVNRIFAEVYGMESRAIYVRGSVAVGRAIYLYSDLDLVLITDQKPQKNLRFEARVAELSEEADEFSLIDVQFVSLSEIEGEWKNKQLWFNLSVQNVCLFGEDILAKQRKIKTNLEMHRFFFGDYWSELEAIKTNILRGNPITYAGAIRGNDFLCRWFARLFLRVSALQLYGETGWLTTDLDTCSFIGRTRLPQYQATFDRVWHLERNPSCDADEIVTVISTSLSITRSLW